jgi:hypothetical protein
MFGRVIGGDFGKKHIILGIVKLETILIRCSRYNIQTFVVPQQQMLLLGNHRASMPFNDGFVRVGIVTEDVTVTVANIWIV